jgi:multidrug resistance protein, MATE family
MSVSPGFASELGSLMRLAWPMILAQLLQVSFGFVDTVMVGRVGPNDLAVVGIGSSLWILVYLGALGMMMSISPIAAHHVGAGARHLVKDVFQQGLWYGLGVALMAFLLVRHSWQVAFWLEVDPEVLPGLRQYMEAIAWGMPAACLALAPRLVAEASGYTKPMMIVLAMLLPMNIFGNWVLVFGQLGFPALGAVGAAWSTAIGQWIGAVCIFGWIFSTRRLPDIRSRDAWARPDVPRILELLRLGMPISITMIMETSLFSAVAVLMGRFGVVPLAAHQIAINYAALMFMVPVGLTLAITVRVGQALGAGDRSAARFRGFLGIGVSAAFMGCSAIFMIFFPEFIASIYTQDTEVIVLAASLLTLAAIFQLFDGLQVAAIGALRGFKDTTRPMLISVVTYWFCGFPLSWYTAFELGLGPRGLWMGLVAGLLLAALLLNLRYYAISAAPAGPRA